MSIEATINTLLGPLVVWRVYPDVSPDGAAFPLIIYQQVGGVAVDFVDQTIPDRDNARVQINVWSKTRLEASQIARSVRVAIMGGPLPAQTYGASVSLYEDALKLYGSRQDFGLWYTP